MDNPNITMEEYIRLEEEKACRRGLSLRLKTDSENDNDKVNMPLIPSPEPTVSCFDDLDFFNDLENEFPAIVYNDAQTPKLDFSTEPVLNPQHIDEFDLKSETSLSECDKEEQNVLNFNDLFPFNLIYPNDSKSDKDNDDDKVDIEHSSGNLSVKPLPDIVYTAYPNPIDMAYQLSGCYLVFIFSTVYTMYSLNEYNIYRIWYGMRKSRTYKGKPHNSHVKPFKRKYKDDRGRVKKCKCFICEKEGHFANDCRSKQGNIARSDDYQELDLDDNWDIVSADFYDSSVYSISEGEGDTHQSISVMVQDTPVEEIVFMAIEEDDESDDELEEEDNQFSVIMLLCSILDHQQR
ncbi:Orf y [Tanacetum coccineum]